jgi:hypothetical protein
MVSTWHNRLGENGQRLTILSVLPRTPLTPAELQVANELSLREAIDELFRIAGEDGRARVIMLDVASQGEEPVFLTEEDVSLRDLAEGLYGSFGNDGQSTTVLRVLGPDDDPLGGLGPAEAGSPADGDTGRGPLAALRRFREAVHRLFGGSADAGIPPTVLSLLVEQTPTSRSHRSGEAHA